MNLAPYIEEKIRRVDSALDEYLPPEDSYPEIIYRAMRYSVVSGGKRIRPILALAACESVGGDIERVLPTACAIEIIHAFSLIHDDLPALDNDDLRRGRPTNHKVFGEAIAILAGDALLALAFETITGRTAGVPPEKVLEVVQRVASAAGTGGMVVGQVVDMISEGKKINRATLEFMHRNKTGALMEVSVVSGGILGGADSDQVKALSLYGDRIGLAFQIIDDVLDIEGESETLGKTPGSDLRKQKSTYPALLGVEESKRLAYKTSDEAIQALNGFDSRAEPLRALARYIVERQA